MIGGGLAGLASAVALAEHGLPVQLLEQRPHLGGRATSYSLPDGSHVDNCQHVTLRCCTNLDDFYRRVGAAHKIRYFDRLFFVDRHNRIAAIRPSILPPPVHLALSFAWFPSLNWADKRSIARAMLSIVRHAGRPPGAAGRSMLDWLRSTRQTDAAIERFWRVVLVSALNEELDRTDALYGLQVFWEGFLATRRGYELGIPSVPLAELYDGCLDAITHRGGQVRLRCAVREIVLQGGRAAGVRLDDGSILPASYVLSAVPHLSLLEILPPHVVESEPAFRDLRNLSVSPITGVHLWFDSTVMELPYLTVLDRTTQWIFNKTLLYEREADRRAHQTTRGQHLQLVISASYDLTERSRQEIIDLCCAELSEILPAVRGAQLLKATVIKEVHATFAPVPGCDRWRPAQRSPIPGLFLAGDWTATGWPATMEGAVRSGYLAAEAIISAAGGRATFLRDGLPPEDLARFWAGR